MQLEDALGRYLTQLRANGRSEHTVLQAQRHLRLLAAWLEEERRSAELDAIDEDVVAEFLTSETACRSARGGAKKPGTLNSLRSSLKTFFGAAARAEWVARNPARFIKRAICSPPPPRSLTAREEERLRSTLAAAESDEGRRDRILVELMLATGVRLSSALALDVEDVDLDEGALLLRKVKGGRAERVFLGPESRDLLREYLGELPTGPVFTRRDGRRISVRQAQRRFRGWRERAGVQKSVTPHSLRHSFAMDLYRRCGDVLLVKRALGHRSISSTLVYAHVGEERLRAALHGQEVASGGT